MGELVQSDMGEQSDRQRLLPHRQAPATKHRFFVPVRQRASVSGGRRISDERQ